MALQNRNNLFHPGASGAFHKNHTAVQRICYQPRSKFIGCIEMKQCTCGFALLQCFPELFSDKECLDSHILDSRHNVKMLKKKKIAKLQHIPEHHGLVRCIQHSEIVQGGIHACRIGIIRIHYEGIPFCPHKLGTVVGRDI